MIPPWQRFTGSGQDQPDLEALQTDVMRFVAILGLCLAAIFALVRSLEPSMSAALDADVLAYRVQAMEARTVELESELLGQRQLADKLAQQIENQRPPVEIQSAPAPAEASIDKPAPATAPALATPAEKPRQSSSSAAAGFTLEFASAAALYSLLQRGEVTLYARTGQQAWRWHGEQQNFSSANLPARIYLMDHLTVPGLFQRVLQTQFDVDNPDLVWGVQLTSAIAAGIQLQMSVAAGGSLVISTDGAVLLAP